MPTQVIKIDPWTLSYTNDEGFIGLEDNVPPMQVQISFDIDPVDPTALKIGNVVLLNSDSLEFNSSGVDTQHAGLARGRLVDGQAYVNIGHVLISQISTLVELKYGVYWADCDQPKSQFGVPRFALQSRAVVQCQAQSNYYSQKWSKLSGWGPQDPTPVYTSPARSLHLTSSWSGLDQIGSHFNSQKCLQMPLGAGRDWVWYPSKTFPIDTSPSPAPAPIPVPKPGS
jgi:hypothetical protein